MRNVLAFEDLMVPGVWRDFRCFQEGNQGRAPVFALTLSFSSSKRIDAAATKSLAMDGVFIPLCKVQLIKQQASCVTYMGTIFSSKVLQIIQCQLACYLGQRYTPTVILLQSYRELCHHIHHYWRQGFNFCQAAQFITLVNHRDKKKKPIEISDFLTVKSYRTSGPMKLKDKASVCLMLFLIIFVGIVGLYLLCFYCHMVCQAVDPLSFNRQGLYPNHLLLPILMQKRMLQSFFRRGGDLVQSHSHWAKTVCFAPDVIEMTFSLITSLLDGISGMNHLI